MISFTNCELGDLREPDLQKISWSNLILGSRLVIVAIGILISGFAPFPKKSRELWLFTKKPRQSAG